MSAPARIGTYIAILAAVFVAAFFAGGLLIPDDAVSAWTEQAQQNTRASQPSEEGAAEQDADHGTADH